MGVYIPGIEIPTWCENCAIFDLEMDECALIGKTPWSWEDETGISTIHRRPGNCPLIEIPAHGRLVDADTMQEEWYRLNFNGKISDGTLAYWNYQLSHLPTVIPADKEVISNDST